MFYIAGAFGGNPENDLITSLLSGYDVNARPVRDPSQSVNVTLDVRLIQLLDVVSGFF